SVCRGPEDSVFGRGSSCLAMRVPKRQLMRPHLADRGPLPAVVRSDSSDRFVSVQDEARMHLEAWAKSDVGQKRNHNEDCFCVDPELGLYMVCDGMGGHAAGEVASARAVEVVRGELTRARAVIDEFAA